MRKTVRFLLVLAVALLLMLCFRALAFTICTVGGNGLSPVLMAGDRVLVNRWSYGLRVGGDGGLFGYGRIGRRAVERGDLVAFENPKNTGEVLVCRCSALPGDTVYHEGQALVVPSLKDCADADHYWLESVGRENQLDSRSLGFISEKHIIGRVTMVVYSHNPAAPFFKGWRSDRLLLPL